MKVCCPRHIKYINGSFSIVKSMHYLCYSCFFKVILRLLMNVTKRLPRASDWKQYVMGVKNIKKLWIQLQAWFLIRIFGKMRYGGKFNLWKIWTYIHINTSSRNGKYLASGAEIIKKIKDLNTHPERWIIFFVHLYVTLFYKIKSIPIQTWCYRFYCQDKK